MFQTCLPVACVLVMADHFLQPFPTGFISLWYRAPRRKTNLLTNSYLGHPKTSSHKSNIHNSPCSCYDFWEKVELFAPPLPVSWASRWWNLMWLVWISHWCHFVTYKRFSPNIGSKVTYLSTYQSQNFAFVSTWSQSWPCGPKKQNCELKEAKMLLVTSLGCVTRSYLSYTCRTLNPACFRTWSALMRSTCSKLAKQILTGIAPFRLKGNSDLSKLILPDQKTDKRRTHTRTHTHTHMHTLTPGWAEHKLLHVVSLTPPHLLPLCPSAGMGLWQFRNRIWQRDSFPKKETQTNKQTNLLTHN